MTDLHPTPLDELEALSAGETLALLPVEALAATIRQLAGELFAIYLSADPAAPARPFVQLKEEGLLWLINKAVFHPRGFALVLHVDRHGNGIGWSLGGDGTEAWKMGDDIDEDALLGRVQALLGC